MRAFVLLKVNPPDTPELMSRLQKQECILEASLIHGPYDCLVEVQAPGLVEINEAVAEIRLIKGVVDTLTSLVVHSWQRQEA
jgi:DNA-binding Lrp family transcriptional regulator